MKYQAVYLNKNTLKAILDNLANKIDANDYQQAQSA